MMDIRCYVHANIIALTQEGIHAINLFPHRVKELNILCYVHANIIALTQEGIHAINLFPHRV